MNKSKSVIYDELISSARKAYKEHNLRLLGAIEKELKRPRSNRREVNVGKISKLTKKDSVIIVPGKVLGNGILDHSVTVGAISFSDEALKKISGNGGKAINLSDFFKQNSKTKGVQIIG